MAGLSGKKGRDLIAEVLDQLKTMDPKIVPFDSTEVEDLETSVTQAVRDVFGSGSPEYETFETFRVSAGPESRADSRAEKQSKFEMGLQKALPRIEELLELMDRVVGKPEDRVQELSSEDMVEVEPAPARKEPAKSAQAPVKEAPKAAPKPPPPQAPKTEEGKDLTAAEGAPRAAAMPKPAAKKQPGKVLIISGTGQEVTMSVDSLLQRLGISVELPGEDPTALTMENLASVDHISFALIVLTGGSKGGLSGLTSVIGMVKSNHELAFKLGFFVGRLGPGAVAVLFEGDRPADLPNQLFGVRYIQYREEGGWQIGLLKLLKANGFFIDANLLFE